MPRFETTNFRGASVVLTLLLLTSLCGCFTVPMDPKYRGPDSRPPEVQEYYSYDRKVPFHSITSEQVHKDSTLTQDRIKMETEAGTLILDYFHGDEPSEELVMVFPILGGRRNMIASYFADYFARHGIDTAIVHRDDKFKKPEYVDELETLLRQSVIRDRIALDYFERIHGKKKFASFGISRGAINVAITAGVEPRLKHNVMALGGTSLVKLFTESNERRIKRYKNKVKSDKGLTEEEFIEFLQKQLKTDPEHYAHFIDARNTLLILSLFDETVPIKFGRQLREQIGKPETIYLMADHRVSLLYTGFVPILPPISRSGFRVFPIDYIETESLAFYRQSFGKEDFSGKHLFFSVMQVPFIAIERLIKLLF